MTDLWEYVADLIDPPGDDWEPLPHQIPPDGDWFSWMLLGGRGAGKTATAAHYMHEHVNGPPCLPNVPGGHWPAIIAPTIGDGVTSCVNGPSGLRRWDPEIKLRALPGGTMVRWPNGCEAKIFGAHTPEDVERLRSGGNRCFVWAEELAAWRYISEAWQHMRYGLRVGPRPHVIVSTTPKNLALIKELKKKAIDEEFDPDNGQVEVVMTVASTADNPHLDSGVKRALFGDYGGTRLGRQELYAEILEDIEGALWNQVLIDMFRINLDRKPPRFDRILVGVDPQGKNKDNGRTDETGIVAVGRVNKWFSYGDYMDRPHGFVLADRTMRGSPKEWAKEAIQLYHDLKADAIVAEINNGWDMVKSNIHSVDPNVRVLEVTATRAKARRAEPVVNMYEQGRMHHVGNFPLLEDQMTTFDQVEPDPAWSPDRMDALVWATKKLMMSGVRTGHAGQRGRGDARHRGRR
jgi:phage terminase large subunit-like protein